MLLQPGGAKPCDVKGRQPFRQDDRIALRHGDVIGEGAGHEFAKNMPVWVERFVIAPIVASHYRIDDDRRSIIERARTVIAHDDGERNPLPVRRDPAQRKQVMAVEGGVRELYPHPSLPHVRLGLLPEPQRGEWIVAVRAPGLKCQHHHTPWFQTVGTVPPSMTYSVPVMEAARGETRNATRSATSFGLAGRPIGMPPRESITICLAPS